MVYASPSDHGKVDANWFRKDFVKKGGRKVLRPDGPQGLGRPRPISRSDGVLGEHRLQRQLRKALAFLQDDLLMVEAVEHLCGGAAAVWSESKRVGMHR